MPDAERPPAPTFGRVPHPTTIDAIVVKERPGLGYDAVPERGPGLLGTCLHSWGGNAWTTPAWKSIHGLFSPGGERYAEALVDYSVQKDGTIVRLNDPRGTRAPWANGDARGAEGDGVAFLAKYGAGAVNSRLVSIEREGGSEPMPAAQIGAVAALIAHWHDQLRVPWDAFPRNPHADGLVTQFQHWEFSSAHKKGTGCPFAGVQGQTDAYQDRARAIMKGWQSGENQPVPIPPPAPPPPAPLLPYPPGFDKFVCDAIWGEAYPTYRFSEGGVVSRVWVAERVFSPLVHHVKVEGGKELFCFASGQTIGRLNPREKFRVLTDAAKG